MDSYYNFQNQGRGVMSPEDVIRLTNSMSSAWKRILAGQLPKNKNAAIYEAGCGPGAFLLFLKSLGYTNISGSDFSENQIKLAQANGLNVKQADSIVDLESYPDDSFQCVVAIDFIEHLSKESAMKFLRHSSRVLKKDGRLIMRMPNGDSPFVGRNLFNDLTHQWAYTTVAMAALLRISGFSKISFYDESFASLECCRWIKLPLMRLAQALLKWLIRAATREQIQYFSPSIFVFADK
ncbi:MAG: class I SAM-dependent methyltransferase [Limisphaerales bacterium]|jgi:cyclopropane fatty-acyl-phospholipid synthase-like methyltransferase